MALALPTVEDVRRRLQARRHLTDLVGELGKHLGPAARDPANLAERPCPVCGPAPPSEVDPEPRLAGPVYPFHQCRACTVLFVRRVLRHDVLRKLYAQRPIYRDYWDLQRADAEAMKGRSIYGPLVERLARLAPTAGTAIDVGCGFGKLTEELGARFTQAIGLELNRRTAAYGRKLFGVDLRTARLEQLDVPEGSVDVVVLNQVLEHLHDVGSVLAAAHRLVKPGGLVWIGVPHGRSLGMRLFGGGHPMVASHVHVNLFTEAALVRLARRTGFNVKGCGTTDGLDVSTADLVLARLPRATGDLLFAPAAALDQGLRRLFSATSLPSALRMGSHLDALLVKP